MDYQGVRSASINRHLHDSICLIVWARPKKCQYLMRYIELEISGYQFDDYVFQLSILLKFQVHAVKITKRQLCTSLISVRPNQGIGIGNQTKVQFRYRYRSQSFFFLNGNPVIIIGSVIIMGFPRNSYSPFPKIMQIFPAGLQGPRNSQSPQLSWGIYLQCT